jgi:hypothetical protein
MRAAALVCGLTAAAGLAGVMAAPAGPERTILLASGSVSTQFAGRQDKDQLGNDMRAGDLNGDGVADLAMGAHWGSVGGRNIQGRSYVAFGGPGWPALLDLASASSSGWSFMGTGFESRLGSAVAVKDVSGDSRADLVLGSVLADPGGQANGGAAYVMLGGESVGGHVDFLTSQPDAFIAGGSQTGGEADRIGTDLAIGDFNGDGRNDLAVAAVFRNDFRGTVFVFWGPISKGSTRNLQSQAADWTLLGPVNNAYFGAALAVADVNGDGRDDLVSGAYTSGDGRVDTGAVFAFFGRAGRGGITDLAKEAADLTVVGPAGSYMGAALSPGSCSCRGQPLAVADLTGDGLVDLLVGAPLDGTRRGAVFLLPGPLGSGRQDLADRPYQKFSGELAEGRLGWTVATGRLDGDSQLDVVLAAPWAAAAGRATAGLFYGLRGPLPGSGSQAVSAAEPALLAQGAEAGAGNAGATVVLADTDGDGSDDLHLGLPDSAPMGRRSVGSVFVVRGPILPTLATATPSPSPSPTQTTTASATATATDTATPTATETTAPSPSATETPPVTDSPTATSSSTVTPVSASRTATPRPSRTAAPPGRNIYLPFGLKSRRRT